MYVCVSAVSVNNIVTSNAVDNQSTSDCRSMCLCEFTLWLSIISLVDQSITTAAQFTSLVSGILLWGQQTPSTGITECVCMHACARVCVCV